MPSTTVTRIVSGGQTGADRAALDFAIEYGIDHGGWVPKGRKTEEGPLPARYRVQETQTSRYRERTEKNVVDSDGTLVVFRGKLSGGSAFTVAMARKYRRPLLLIDIEKVPRLEAAGQIGPWAAQHSIGVLNVAGPRESSCPGIYSQVRALLKAAFGNPSG